MTISRQLRRRGQSLKPCRGCAGGGGMISVVADIIDALSLGRYGSGSPVLYAGPVGALGGSMPEALSLRRRFAGGVGVWGGGSGVSGSETRPPSVPSGRRCDGVGYSEEE